MATVLTNKLFLILCFVLRPTNVRMTSVKHPKITMASSHKTTHNKTNVMTTQQFDWIGDRIVFGDVVLEEKKREDGYTLSEPRDSPHAVLVAAVYGVNRDAQLCSGALLTARWVLTAAHCFTANGSAPARVVLYAGGHSLQEVKDQRPAPGSQLTSTGHYVVHPRYRAGEAQWDVALARAPKRFRLTDTVNILELANTPWAHSDYRPCEYTGYGRVHADATHPDDMTRKTHELRVESPCHCHVARDPDGSHYLCAEPREDYGVCVGDSGGGLVCDGRVQGIALRLVELKNSVTCEAAAGQGGVTCGGHNTLSVFLNIVPLVEWVRSYTSEPHVTDGGQPTTTPHYGHGCRVTLATAIVTVPFIIHVITI